MLGSMPHACWDSDREGSITWTTLPDSFFDQEDPIEGTSRLEAVALRFEHLIRCLWKLQLVRSRFSAYGQYLQNLEKSGRGLLLDILSNCYPSAENQGRVPKQLRDRRQEALDYSVFQRFNFWEETASDVPVVGSSSSHEWQNAD